MADSRAATVGGLALGGLLGVVAAAQPWWQTASAGAEANFAGTESTGGLSRALAYVVLAGTLLVLVLKARGRRVVAVLLTGVGLTMAVLGFLRQRPGAEAVRAKVRSISLDDQFSPTVTAWPYLFGAAGLLVMGGAVQLWRRAPHWPARRDRFQRTGGAPATTADDDPAQVWRALDAGLDPTDVDDQGQGAADVRGPRDPVVQNRRAGDTMGAQPEQQHHSTKPQHPVGPDRSLPSDRLSGAGQSPWTGPPSPEPK